MDSCKFSNKANSHAFEVEIHTLILAIYTHFGHFGRYDAKAKLFCQKSFVPVTRAGVFIWENFTEISVAKTEISVTRPARPLI